ncbi:DNA/RNA polymerase [Clavulina sp. PMI_390]|nr:DNA/RNA polymerase [Clavulina sp. PMI_390]
MPPIDPSLIKAMGGPSSGKAGVTRDQEETNRIIAEASKNSKYFQEVKRRDEQLRERIKKLLHRRDEVMGMVDVAQAQLHADQMIAELERERDLSKIICHVDLDAFFASVEALSDPSLVGKAFGVGHGVLSTASYEARKYGVRSGMATFIAKKLCPHLVIVRAHYQKYVEKSKQVMDVLKTFDPDMCIMGQDEAYLTLNDYCDTHQLTPEECVEKLRAEVHAASQLTCSAGIAPNRMLAKISSDRNKPNGQYYLQPNVEVIGNFMKELPIRKVPGIGRVSERVLSELGIQTCGEVFAQRAMLSAMDNDPQKLSILPVGLRRLLQAYLGLGSNVVEPPSREGRKSIGVESTFHPISDKTILLEKLEHIAQELEEDMQRSGWAGKTITLKYKLDTHQTFTRARALSRYITTKQEILPIAKELLVKELPLRLRLLGIRVTSLKDLRPSVNPHGIEKFFDQAAEKSKKRKLEHEEDFEMTADTSLMELDDMFDDDEDDSSAVPGDVGSSEMPIMPAIAGDLETDNSPFTFETPPTAVGLEPPGSPTKSSSPRKPQHRPPTQDAATQPQTCPICQRHLNVDNAGFNEHIDYCLSKDMILETAASSDTSGSGGSRSRQALLNLSPRGRNPKKRARVSAE